MNREAGPAEEACGPGDRTTVGPIGLLPSLITLGNIVCGFAAVCFATIGLVTLVLAPAPEIEQSRIVALVTPLRGADPFAIAAALIFVAMIFDALDGKVARMTNLTTEFGAQLDSLCDIVSFGVAPAYLVFLEVLSKDLFRHYRYAWVCAVLYVVCAALRLARFNVETQPDEESHMHFRGLPTPAAAGVLAGLTIVNANLPFDYPWAAKVMPFVAVILAGLMISQVRYIHLLNVLFRHKKPFTYLVLLVFLMFVVFALAQHTELIFLTGFAAYTLSGPCVLLWGLFKGPTRSRSVGPRS